MSLSSALSTAQSILSNTATQTSTISKNITNAGNSNYVRREAQLATTSWGAQIVSISRAANDVLFRDNIGGISAASGQNALLGGIDQIRALLGGNDYETAPSTLIGNFRNTLQLFASKPGDTSAAQTAIAEAVTLADGIREMSGEVQRLGLDMDLEIGRQVGELNKLLAEFEGVNNDVRNATLTGKDASDALDQRDRLLRGIAEIVGITTVEGQGNELSIYTKNGATLFETVPRAVSVDATAGNAILIDGVELAAGAGGATSASGSLAALLQVRDTVAPTFQKQLDEIARGLVTAFAETPADDASGLPARPGLFVWDGAAIPAEGAIEPGIALSLKVNADFIPPDGSPLRLRDGGASGDGYWRNPGDPEPHAGFSDVLSGYLDALEKPVDFDPAALAGDSAGLITYAANSLGWLESLRQQADQSAEMKNAAYYRTTEALSNATGVNLDEEMAKLLQLEQSYKASARLIAAVDEMIDNLLAAVR